MSQLPLQKYWINQPSVLDPDHYLHAKTVLANPSSVENGGKVMVFLDSITATIPPRNRRQAFTVFASSLLVAYQPKSSTSSSS